MAVDPVDAAAGDDRALEPQALRVDEVVVHAVAELLEVGGGVLELAAARVDDVAVETAADPPLEVGVRVEAVERADRGRPRVERQLVAVLPVHVRPGGVRRALGVHEQPVEVEEERADHRPSASSRPRP